ncbi:hypothetical protein [Streptosporangium roseum]|uniref:SbtR family transcriptional regulator n=1 Tax=Streptosporangium roseum TaxID=2001 RepID=UPI003331BD89
MGQLLGRKRPSLQLLAVDGFDGSGRVVGSVTHCPARHTARGDPAALFTLLSRVMANGAENAAVKSALSAAEFDLRTAAPSVAADLTRHVTDLLDRAHAAGAVRHDLTAEELMALVAGPFAAIRHAGAETSPQRSAHIAQLILDGLRPQPR